MIRQIFFVLQPSSLQDSLSLPLSGLSYTNELLIVSSAVLVLGGLSIGVFYSDTESTSSMLVEINRINRDILNEKIDVISADTSATHVVFSLSNYGSRDTEITAVLDSDANSIDCTSNNADSANFVVLTGKHMEVSCVLQGDDKYYAVTDTGQILKVIP